ncbi:hypothetical protein D3C71_662110 [compost metagenome]
MAGFPGDGGKKHGWVHAGKSAAGFQPLGAQEKRIRPEHEIHMRGLRTLRQIDEIIAGKHPVYTAVGTPPRLAAEPGWGQRHADMKLGRD